MCNYTTGAPYTSCCFVWWKYVAIMYTSKANNNPAWCMGERCATLFKCSVLLRKPQAKMYWLHNKCIVNATQALTPPCLILHTSSKQVRSARTPSWLKKEPGWFNIANWCSKARDILHLKVGWELQRTGSVHTNNKLWTKHLKANESYNGAIWSLALPVHLFKCAWMACMHIREDTRFTWASPSISQLIFYDSFSLPWKGW